MSDSSKKTRSNNPNAPRISYPLYLAEKDNFAGTLIGAMLYGARAHTSAYLTVLTLPGRCHPGVVVILFFRCMCALIDPINPTRRNIKWWPVAHAVTMFSVVTVYTTMNLQLQSTSYIDDREFSGVDGGLPGPFGYQLFIHPKAINVISTAMFPLNQWLADGLLVSPGTNSAA